MKTFALGSIVTWRSQAAGSWVIKIGTVIEVVPAFARMKSKIKTPGCARNHESYVVEVTIHSKAAPGKPTRTLKPALYWPRVSNLKLVTVTGDLMSEDLKIDHLPMQIIDGDKNLLWKDIQGSEQAIANAESTN